MASVPDDAGGDDLLAGVPVSDEWVPVARLVLPEYQRPVRRQHVLRIARDFDPDLFEPLKINRRVSGEEVIIDGQHRYLAILEMGWLDQNVPCRVYHGLPPEREGRIFESQAPSMRHSLQKLDEFRVKYWRRDSLTTEIVEVVTSAGLDIDWRGSGQRATIRAVDTLRTLYEFQGALYLRRTLVALRDCFGDEQAAFIRPVLIGMSSFLVRYHGDPLFERAELVARCHSAGLSGVQQKAREIAALLGHTGLAMTMGRGLHHVYNERRTTRRLPDWQEQFRTPELEARRRGRIGDTKRGTKERGRLTYRVGDSVHHEGFGYGLVLEVRATEDDQRVRVRFEDGPERVLSARHSPLRHTA